MNQKIFSRVLTIAGSLCPTSKEMRSSHIAFLIRKGKIVHIGWNKYKTHPYNLNHPYHDGTTYRHAELDVCFKSGKEYLDGYSMVVIRINKLGIVRNSLPCKGCQSVIKQFGIDDVWYSTSFGEIVKMI